MSTIRSASARLFPARVVLAGLSSIFRRRSPRVNPLERLVIALALFASLIVPASPALADSPPASYYSSAAIPAGRSLTHVTGRFITASSRVFVTVDLSTWPGETFNQPGLKVDTVRDGYFDVRTLDSSVAPASGVPFNFVVFNASTVAPYYTIGRSTLHSGASQIVVSHSAATTNSIVILTIDATSLSSSSSVTQGLKVDGHGAGSFTVKTLSLTAAQGDIPFNYLIVNDASRDLAGRQTIPSGAVRVQFSKNVITNPVGILLTVDTTGLSNVKALPGIFVLTRGAGSMYVSTQTRTLAPSSGVPFGFALLEPPNRWEEYGPTGFSGDTWSIVADPRNRQIIYAASSFGGVWKTVNGGDSWIAAWETTSKTPIPQAPIYRLTMDPANPNRLYALNRGDGAVWITDNAAAGWTQFRQNAPINSLYRPGGALVAAPGGLLWACSNQGIYLIQPALSSSNWTLTQPPSSATGKTGTYACSDVAIGTDGATYAAFRDVGIWRLRSGTWTKLKNPITGGRPLRLELNASKFYIAYDCLVFVNDLATLNRTDLTSFENTWRQSTPSSGLLPAGQFQTGDENKICGGTQGGYTTAAAVSPTDGNHFIIGGSGAKLTRDGGQTWIDTGALPELGADQHQIIFWSDTVILAAHDFGISISTDGGASWHQAENNRRVTDGPPVTEFYNFMVSRPDQFGRPLVGGAAQDRGSTSMVGRTSAFYTSGGEQGLGIVAPPLTNRRSSDGQRSSVFRTYTTFGGKPGVLNVCDSELPGPDYLPPTSYVDGEPVIDEMAWPITSHTAPGPNGTTLRNNMTCANAQSFLATDNPITAMAVSNAAVDKILVGTTKGDVYRAVAGSDGMRFERIIVSNPQVQVTAIGFLSDSLAFVGFANGAIIRVSQPFGTVSNSPTPLFRNARVVGFANLYGSTQEVYAALANSVWRSPDGGATWTDLTGAAGSPLVTSLATGVGVVGIARDQNHPFLYVATGFGNWYGNWSSTRDPGVFRTALPTSGSWTRFSDGLPGIVPISGLGISANRAIFISTQGRGIWWRRDIVAVPPNSGVNTPDDGESSLGATQLFTTTCSYPTGWRDIHTLEFKLTLGLGPEDGDPYALWVEFDQDANLIRFHDPDTGEISEGTPGENRVLSNRYAELDLAKTTAKGRGPTNPTVDIAWSVRLLRPTLGVPLAQYLRVADDFGSSTIWDKVGTWSVLGPKFLPLIASNATGW